MIYAQAGAQYGFATLRTTLPMLPMITAVRYMCAKNGLVTGKGAPWHAISGYLLFWQASQEVEEQINHRRLHLWQPEWFSRFPNAASPDDRGWPYRGWPGRTSHLYTAILSSR